MIYTFLTQADIEAAIKPQYLNQLLEDQPANHISRNEAAAVSYVKAYLANRFDNSKTFRPIKEFNPLFEYDGPSPPSGDLGGGFTEWVYWNGKIYGAKIEVPGTAVVDAPPAESMVPDFEGSIYWQENDPRDANIVHLITNITVFYLHRHVNPVRIPTFWIDLYNQAKDWLVDVKNSNITPEFERVIEETSDNIPWGSNEQQQHLY